MISFSESNTNQKGKLHFGFIESMTERRNVALITIAVLFLLLTIRGAFSFWKYPFLVLYGCIFIYTFIFKKELVFSSLLKLFRRFYLAFILFLILIIAYIFSHKNFLIVFKDAVNTSILFSLFWLLFIYVQSRDVLIKFIKGYLKLVLFIAVFISILNLVKLFNIAEINFGYYTTFPSGVSMNNYEVDYNFILLPIFFGYIYIIYVFRNEISKGKRIFFNGVLFLFSLCIFLSGSRRGITALSLITFALLVVQVTSLFKRQKVALSIVAKNSRLLIAGLVISVILGLTIVQLTDYKFKNSALRLTGSKSILTVKQNIASIMVRYLLMINKGASYHSVYDWLWSPEFDPRDPDSSWGNRIHKSVFPLEGENVEIVPYNSIGYLVDKTCNAGAWNGNTYSYTEIGKFKLENETRVKSSVFCYVSDDFNGDWVSLSCGGAVDGVKIVEYNLLEKGRWSKLSLDLKCGIGDVFFYLNFAKNAVKEFSSLTGYVVFAYPSVEFSKVGDSSSLYNMSNKTNFRDSKSPQRSLAIYSYNLKSIKFLLKSQEDSDRIRKFIDGLVNEDTTYLPLKNVLFVDTVSSNLSENRLAKWNFALKIYIKEYNLKQKIIGGGFNHLNWYGNYFIKDKTTCDYPHNPFLSILLYSGVIGLVLYIVLLYQLTRYYIKYIKAYPVIFAFFLVTLYFSFFSGTSPFDPPIMGFFVMLPFFIHYIYKKESSRSFESTSGLNEDSDNRN